MLVQIFIDNKLIGKDGVVKQFSVYMAVYINILLHLFCNNEIEKSKLDTFNRSAPKSTMNFVTDFTLY